MFVAYDILVCQCFEQTVCLHLEGKDFVPMFVVTDHVLAAKFFALMDVYYEMQHVV
jgi:hypothetical protein